MDDRIPGIDSVLLAKYAEHISDDAPLPTA